MKIFIDTANLEDIENCLRRGFASGITTNPALFAREPKSSFEGHVKKIIDLINKYQPGIHLSIEVFTTDPAEMLKQAKQFIDQFHYPQISIKVHVGWDELAIISKLAKAGISVNCTACMTVTQAIMAARAGANYVSLFWGRIRDGGVNEANKDDRDQVIAKKIRDDSDFDPASVVQSVRKILDQDKIDCEIIIGSIRTVLDIRDAGIAGAHIITVPPKFYPDMMWHYKTDEIVQEFMREFSGWLSK